MKKEITVTEITCNICGKVLPPSQTWGVGLYKGKGRNAGEGEVWLSGKTYDDLSKFDTHICNKCHVELCWCHPGGINNPTNKAGPR